MEAASFPADNQLRRYNKWLTIINVLVAFYIFITPLLPGLFFYINKYSKDPPAYSGKLSESSDKKPTGNRLVIPSILLDEKIHEGPSEATLSKGVWRRPNTAVPPAENNTVLAGHIFTYTTPAVFYNLSKVNVGEKLAVYWEGSEYLYEVINKQAVSPNSAQVEAPTQEARLTLYTCTPLWNPVNRLVVTANLLEVTAL